MYLRHIPRWIQWALPKAVYHLKNEDEKNVYLTFDDGPIPEVTEYILDTLKAYDAKATFFCVGDNVRKHPLIFHRILAEGHQIGNHTFHHIDGYKTKSQKYFKDVLEAEYYIPSKLFRPPYGHITHQQARFIQKRGFRLVLWSLLTADFDMKLTKENMWNYVKKNLQSGDIVVLHDNIKSFEKVKFVLPLILEHGIKREWNFKSIPQ